MKNKKIKVAIIDTGIDKNHEFLKDSIFGGYSLKFEGGNIVRESSYDDENGHGTACASIILNECSNVEFLIIKIMNKDGKSNVLLVENALENLLGTDIYIINMSFSVNENIDSNLHDICSKLVKEGKILVASLDNNICDSFPAYFDNVIGVRGHILESKNAIWFNKDKKIQCIIDNNPFISCSINNTYKMWPQSNSFATAKLSGLICKMVEDNCNSIDDLNYYCICNLLEKRAIRSIWGDNDLRYRKRCPQKNDWYLGNDNYLIKEIYSFLKEKGKMLKEIENICDYELLTLDGELSFDNSYEFIKSICNKLNININYMNIDKYDLLSIGTLVKFIERNLRENHI